MNEITIGDKIYISSKRAAEITGYAKDYVGQLCREGHVDAKMVGRSWYVYEPSIRTHRFGADAAMPEEAPETPEEAEREQNAASEAVAEPVSAWERPKYTPEEPQQIPEITAPAYKEPEIPAQETLTDMQAAWREWFERKQEAAEEVEIHQIQEDAAGDTEEDEPEMEQEMEEAGEIDEIDETGQEIEGETTEIPLHRIHPAAPEPHIRPVEAPAAPAQRVMEVQKAPVKAAYASEYAASQAPEARIVHERVVRRAGTAPAGIRGARRAEKAAARAQKGGNAPMVAVLIGVSIIAVAVGYIGSGLADRYLEIFGSNNPVINFLVGTREFNR